MSQQREQAYPQNPQENENNSSASESMQHVFAARRQRAEERKAQQALLAESQTQVSTNPQSEEHNQLRNRIRDIVSQDAPRFLLLFHEPEGQ